MQEYLQLSILVEPLLDSDMIGTVLYGYFYSLMILVVSFMNIYSVDKIEFLYNEQRCIAFKHNVFFIIQKSENRKIVSKKTLLLELIGYIILLLMFILLIGGMFLDVKTSIILLGVYMFIVSAFGITTGQFYRIVQKQEKKKTLNSALNLLKVRYYTDIQSFHPLDEYIIETGTAKKDKYCKGLAILTSYIQELKYKGRAYAVYAYVFPDAESSKTYFKKCTGVTKNEDFGFWLSLDWRASYAAYYRNCAYRIIGFGQQDFVNAVNYFGENFPIGQDDLINEMRII